MKMHPLRSSVLALANVIALVSGTNFLPSDVLLSGVEDPGWFKQNVPILDVPSQKIKEIYYYRWQTYREHLSYTGPQYGYISTEFLGPVGYSAPYGGIVAAAGHHITEGRWLRDQRPGKDLVNYWIAGPGQTAKEANYGLNPDTFDWAHQYSFWAARSVWQQCLVIGDSDFVVGHLDNLVRQYRNWDNHFDTDLGLYWQAPVWDASEYTASSYETDPADPYHGGYGFRPTLNAYQYGDAMAIAAIAKMKGDTTLASEFAEKAKALRAAMQNLLWDKNDQFFKHRARDNNPTGSLVGTREYMGYIPWMFEMPEGGSYSAAFAQLKDSNGFKSTYGPTSAERRSQWFMHEALDGCCRWDGPSWPFATSQVLTSVENLLNDYPSQPYINADDYAQLVETYAATQYKNGKPYVAEAHHPDEDRWIYDSTEHSEDYNHSTFIENIIAGLIGLRAKADNSLVINPLTPSSWDHFALENVPYHGHNVTVVWDQTGSHYNQGQGLRVWVDDHLVTTRTDRGPLNIQVGSVIKQNVDFQVNIAANPMKFDQGPKPITSYTSSIGGDDPWHAIDGTILRLGIPQNSRWTTYGSSNSEDYYGVDLRRPKSFSTIHLYFYDDAGGVRIPTTYDLQYWTGSTWNTIPSQHRTGTLSNNARITITFPKIATSQIRVVAPNRGNGNGWGISELEIWAEPIFQIANVNSGKLMGVQNMSTQNSANIQQYEDNGTRDHLWRFVSSPGGWAKLRNLNSGKVLAVAGASQQNSAQLQQFDDNGSEDHLWRVEDKGKGQFVIRNKNSGLVAGVDRESKENGANVVQFTDSGTLDHLWMLFPAVPVEK